MYRFVQPFCSILNERLTRLINPETWMSCGFFPDMLLQEFMIVLQMLIIFWFLSQAFVTDVHEDEISVAFENE